MPYAIIATDKPGTAELRASVRPAHLEYLKSQVSLILAAGALLEDDGSGGHGSLLIIDTEDRAVAERFCAEDPYAQAGLFEKVVVTRWRKVFFDKQVVA